MPVATVVAILCAWRPTWWRVWVIPPIAGAATLAGMLLRQRRVDVQTSVR